MKFIFLLFSLISFNAFSNGDCILNLLWGHGGAKKINDSAMYKGIKGNNIFQGCGVGGKKAYNTIDYQMWQTGYNGDNRFGMVDNAGLNLIMDIQTEQLVAGIEDVNDKEKLTSKKYDYNRYEAEHLRGIFGDRSNTISNVRDVIGAVGFTRLAHCVEM